MEKNGWKGMEMSLPPGLPLCAHSIPRASRVGPQVFVRSGPQFVFLFGRPRLFSFLAAAIPAAITTATRVLNTWMLLGGQSSHIPDRIATLGLHQQTYLSIMVPHATLQCCPKAQWTTFLATGAEGTPFSHRASCSQRCSPGCLGSLGLGC